MRDNTRLVKLAQTVVDAVTFDDSGSGGRGGNGGLISRETIRAVDTLRLELLAIKAEPVTAEAR